MLIKTKITRGETLEQILAASLNERWASYGKGFITEVRWIRTLHLNYLSAETQ
jgi:hypothetical protein